MSDFKVSHGFGEDNARPVVYLYEGSVESAGKDCRFFFQYDERDGERLLEFVDEPDSDFDFEGFENYCYAEVEKLWNKEEK